MDAAQSAMCNREKGIAAVTKHGNEITKRGGSRRILKTSRGTPPDICFRDIMAAGGNSVTDALQVDLDVFRTDVNHLKREVVASICTTSEPMGDRVRVDGIPFEGAAVPYIGVFAFPDA
jgi:hypothetical protein